MIIIQQNTKKNNFQLNEMSRNQFNKHRNNTNQFKTIAMER